MKKHIIVVFILFAQMLSAQDSGKKTYGAGEFETKLIEFFAKNKKHDKNAAMAYIDKFDKYKNKNKVLVIEILDLIGDRGVKAEKYFETFLHSSLLIEDFPKDKNQSTNSWLTAYKRYFKQKKGKVGDRIKFIESNFNVLLSSMMNPKSRTNWKVSGSLFYDTSDIIKYSFLDTNLKCGFGSDSLSIEGVSGSFLPSKQVIEVDEAKYFWGNGSYARDSLFAVAKNFKIDVSEKGYVADSVVLTSKHYVTRRILGKIKDHGELRGKDVYPIFTSYNTSFFVKNIEKGVDFSGGVMMRGNDFYGVGGEDHNANLYFKKGNKKVVTLSSKAILFQRNKFTSGKSDISIKVKEDSIYHPDIAFNFNFEDGKLLIRKNSNRLSQSAYSNSYNNLDMFLKSVAWTLGENEVYFNTEAHIDVPFVSNKYYEDEIFKKFRGTNRVNPLIKLRRMYDEYEGMTYFPIELVANYMKMPNKYATHLLMDLAEYGYVYLEVDLGRVRFSERFLNVVDAHRNRIDYDVITFQTPEGEPTRGFVDLEKGEITILGIDRVNLSNEKRVFVVLKDTLTVLGNLDFNFDGNVNVGNYEFAGSDYSFIYDDFKISMNGNQNMAYYVPSWEKNKSGKFYYVKVRNKIDSLRGELNIDDPSNKSGRLKLAQYPIFDCTQDAYVFYDLPQIKDTVYKRDEVYVQLEPFTLDSLNAVSSRDVEFRGRVFTNGIFPDFENGLKVQKDYSIGFTYATEPEGMALYGQGVFRDTISLDMDGLNGRGRVSYLSSNFMSDNIEFYPDSLMSVTKKFNIDLVKSDSVSTPYVLADSVKVFWKPRQDSLSISLLGKPFVMYDSTLTGTGVLTFTDNKLTGSGNLDFETAELSGRNFRYYSDYFEGENIDFKLRETKDSPFEFGITNANGRVELDTRKGYFELQDGNASVEFIENKYKAFIDNVIWNIDDKTIDLKNKDENNTPWFVSQDSLQDSLRFQSKLANYSLITNEIKASYLEGIEVADALIYPDELKLVIMENGWMEGLQNATVKIGVGRNEHVLDRADVTIVSKNKYSGSADYFYTDIDEIKHPIHLDELYVDSISKTSVGRGDLHMGEDFMLNPYFTFNGKVEVDGGSPFLKFRGYSGIENYCGNIETGAIPIYDYIDPHNVRAQIKNFDNDPKYSFIYNGIYSVDSSYNAAFLSTDKSLLDVDFISAKGRISYDEPEGCYILGGDTVNNIIENEVRFYNDECRLGAKGLMKFYNPDQIIDVKAFGNIDFDMNSEEMKVDLVLGLNLKFNKHVMDAIRRDLQSGGSKAVMEKTSDLQNMAFSRFTNKPLPQGSNSHDLFNLGQKIPDNLKFSILMTDMKFEWDADQNLFLSDNNISIQSFDGVWVNKIYNGRVEIKKRRSGDEYTIYFVNSNGKYYYFKYHDNVLDFHTNQRQIMEQFDSIKDEDREFVIDGVNYRFKKSSRLKVKSFQAKYI
ncbi:MAG: hypothetical protein KAH10_01600 [Flavobacteriales bacterium]|nr:hypothetical protein [Flavobacteriales bacterium]